MSLLRSVMAAKNLSQFLFGEILMTSEYLKKGSLRSDPETLLERLNHENPKFFYLKVLGAKEWVHDPEEV